VGSLVAEYETVEFPCAVQQKNTTYCIVERRDVVATGGTPHRWLGTQAGNQMRNPIIALFYLGTCNCCRNSFLPGNIADQSPGGHGKSKIKFTNSIVKMDRLLDPPVQSNIGSFMVSTAAKAFLRNITM
jgi:hypothetical protein